MFEKFFNLSLSGEEWVEILNEWGQEADWTYSNQESADDDDKKHLLNKWAHKNPPPEEVVDWLQTHFGGNIWTIPDAKESHFLDCVFTKDRNDQNIDSTLAGLVKYVDANDFMAAAERANEREHLRYPNTSFENLSLNQWHGHMAVVVNFLHNRRHNALSTYLKAFPEALNANEHHVTVGMLMAVNEKGWKAYIDAGGSIFEKNQKDPLTNKVSNKKMPLWLWLIQKKIYHDGLKSVLNNLLVRLHEDRPPQENELVINDDDWKELNQHKTLIHNEMQMIEFEKNINQDWKSSLKSNKLWREWRSTDGANFMFWLAAKRPGDFLKQAVKIKKNQTLIKKTDAQGRDIAMYLLTGMMTQDLGSYRRAEKITREIWPQVWSDLKPDINLSPSKGLFAETLESPETALFDNMSRFDKLQSSYYQTHIHAPLKENPGLLWNGLDEHNLKHVFDNPNVSMRMVRLLSATGNGTTPETFKTRVDALTPTAQALFLTLCCSHETLNAWPTDVRTDIVQRVKHMTENHQDLAIHLQPEDYQKMLDWTKQHVRSWNKAEWITDWETTMEKMRLLKTIEANAYERPVQTKRKM